MRILLDLDEVLADFVGGICSMYDVPKDILLSHWEEGKWDIIPPLDKWIQSRGFSEGMVNEQVFWRRLNNHTRFWTDLQPLPWMREMLDLARSYGDNWRIVSTPSRCQSSWTGKGIWCMGKLGNVEGLYRLRLTYDKTEFARSDAVLIDDQESTVEKFVLAGGKGIVFPAYHNNLSQYRHDPVKYVKEQLEKLR